MPRYQVRPELACGLSPITGEHSWSIQREEQQAEGKTAAAQVVKCAHCKLRADDKTSAKAFEMAAFNQRAAARQKAIQRDSAVFKRMNKRRSA